jgi:hypothetical protein
MEHERLVKPVRFGSGVLRRGRLLRAVAAVVEQRRISGLGAAEMLPERRDEHVATGLLVVEGAHLQPVLGRFDASAKQALHRLDVVHASMEGRHPGRVGIDPDEERVDGSSHRGLPLTAVIRWNIPALWMSTYYQASHWDSRAPLRRPSQITAAIGRGAEGTGDGSSGKCRRQAVRRVVVMRSAALGHGRRRRGGTRSHNGVSARIGWLAGAQVVTSTASTCSMAGDVTVPAPGAVSSLSAG